MRRLLQTIRDNSLSIVLFLLFVICIVGQCFASWRLSNETLEAHGQPSITFGRNLVSGTFMQGLASNWQAAFLQLASLIMFSGLLYQRGAAHSRDPLKPVSEKEKRKIAFRYSWFYRNSLFLAFFLLFLFSFALHIASGCAAYNEDRTLTGRPPLSVSAFLLSAKFWSSTLQTWQAEYVAIAIFVVFSIFLRQEYSAESKPVEASNEETGKENS
jgi:hypothetical protein